MTAVPRQSLPALRKALFAIQDASGGGARVFCCKHTERLPGGASAGLLHLPHVVRSVYSKTKNPRQLYGLHRKLIGDLRTRRTDPLCIDSVA